uniref:Zinc finger and BTB domain containing 11 n=1 Tax=Astyanax mexicanus TaxID=7994 RepID=A0A8B9JLH2_ASTMX
MSSEESYLAIRRYLTDERQPYAPGTPGNTKRKIRKAAACYIVRDGVLFYQRRQKGLDHFSELEVVLQADRRRGLIGEAHLSSSGEHLNSQLTWETISQKYWWRGILKQVKDYIKDCQCQSKQERNRNGAEDGTGLAAAQRQRTRASDEEEEDEDNEDIDEDLNQSFPVRSKASRVDKHELVFVDSKGVVQQFLPKHGQTMLDKLNEQRLNNQFCDITLLIEGEELRAHKAVLAACSEYFRELFVEKGAISSHEAVIDLSGFSKASFLPLLEFAYTSQLTFNFCVMADIATLARYLLMPEVLQICEKVHKKVEEQKLMVYQQGDVHTVVATQVMPSDAVQPGTMTVVTHSGQAGSSESLAVVQACWTVEERQVEDTSVVESVESGALIVQVDPDKMVPAENVDMAAVPAVTALKKEPAVGPAEVPPQSEPSVQSPAPATPRKRGRPPKAKQVAPPPPPEPDPVEVDAVESSSTEGEVKKEEQESVDPNKRNLRKRSMREGGYVRLHMGLEKEEKGLTLAQTVKKRSADSPDVEIISDTEKTLLEEAELAAREVAPVEEEVVQDKQEGAVDGEHTCGECGLVFQRRYALIMHTLKHEKSRGFKCTLCNKEFQYATSLRAHLARHKHQKSQRVAASRGPALEDAEEPEGQSKGRTKREFVCDICGKTLPKLYSLRIHMLTHTGVRPHACRLCGKSFATKHSLNMHRALHDSVKRFHCTICEKSFVTKRSLDEHTSIHTGESKYSCSQCGTSFHRASGLSKHLKKHQPKPMVRAFQCTHCDKSFFELKDLQQHMNKHLGLKPFQCQVCGKCYSWKKDWYSHVKSHTVAEPFRCNVCGKEFFEKALFRRHVKKATHGKKGRVKQNLERECEHCGRKFTQLREYRRHMNNHQGVKPFECLTCGVAWADARSLKRHVRTHTGERPYVCPLCEEAHIDARTLRKHITKYHGDHLPGKIMLEKDTLQFHNQGTQVEHAVSILSPELPPELQPPQPPPSEEIETVLITEETVEAVEAVQAVSEGSISTLSDQSIMQVVNYVLAQQAGIKVEEAADIIQTMEVEVAHVAEVE